MAAARKLLRTFASAPDPRRHARAIHSELAQAVGWSAPDQARIDGLGAWLATHPPLTGLRTRCKHVLLKVADTV